MSDTEPQFFDVGARRIAYLQTLDGGKEPGLIWLAGLKSDMTSTKAAALAEWAERTGPVLTRFDYSGHGRSSGRFEDATISDWLEEAGAVFTRLTAGPQILVGSSTGGYVALLLLRQLLAAGSRDAERIRCLVLIAPAWDLTQDLMWDVLPEDARREIMEQGVHYRPSPYGEPYALTRQFIEDGRKHLIRGHAFDPGRPVLILHGRLDPDVPFAHSLALREMLPGGWGEITEVPDGDHRLSRPVDLGRLFGLVERFGGAVSCERIALSQNEPTIAPKLRTRLRRAIPADLSSLHDYNIVSYQVDCAMRRIEIRLEPPKWLEKETARSLIFEGVEGYRFSNDAFGNIVLAIRTISIEEFLNSHRDEVRESYRIAGAPGPWASDLNSAETLTKKGIKAVVLSSSYGLSGWVLSRDTVLNVDATTLNNSESSVARTIRARRLDIGLSEIEIANRASLNVNCYCDVEDHADEFLTALTLAEVRRICSVLDLKLFNLIEEVLVGGAKEQSGFAFSIYRDELARAMRIKAQLSPAELADKIGFEERAVENIEGNRDFFETWSIELICELADTLAIPRNWLILA